MTGAEGGSRTRTSFRTTDLSRFEVIILEIIIDFADHVSTRTVSKISSSMSCVGIANKTSNRPVSIMWCFLPRSPLDGFDWRFFVGPATDKNIFVPNEQLMQWMK